MRLTVLAVSLISAVAWAEAKPSLIVLDLEAKGAQPLQAQAATQGVVRGLRELDTFQVLSADDVRNLLAIERTRQLMGQGEGSNGLAEMGKALGARHAVVGSVTRVGDKLTVEIRLVDTQKQTVISQKTLGPVAGMEQVAAGLTGLAQELMAPLLSQEQGALLVQSSELGSEVLVDGALVGSTPMKTPIPLSRGQHRLQIRRDGFIEQSRPVRIDTGQTSTENFLMSPSPDYAEAWKIRHGRRRVGAYIATVAAAGSIVGALVLGSDISNTYVNQFVPRQAALSEQPLPTQYAYARPAAAQTIWQQCGTDHSGCLRDAQGYSGQLLGEEIATWTLSVVAVGATAAACYLWLTGEDPNRYMKLVASAGPQGGGLVLVGRF